METRALILIALLALAPAVHAMDGGGWFNQWYEQWSQQEQRVEQRGQQVQKVEKTRCELKIEKYERKVEENPDSHYYSWKLNTWLERCSGEE